MIKFICDLMIQQSGRLRLEDHLVRIPSNNPDFGLAFRVVESYHNGTLSDVSAISANGGAMDGVLLRPHVSCVTDYLRSHYLNRCDNPGFTLYIYRNLQLQNGCHVYAQARIELPLHRSNEELQSVYDQVLVGAKYEAITLVDSKPPVIKWINQQYVIGPGSVFKAVAFFGFAMASLLRKRSNKNQLQMSQIRHICPFLSYISQ